MKKYTKGELAKAILGLAVAGGVVVTVAALPGLAIVFKVLDADSARDRYRIKRTVKRLHDQGVIVRRIKNGVEEMVVTPKGQLLIDQYLLDDIAIKTPKHWDRYWRVVMFDVPETKRRMRQELSWKLKDVGMYDVQHSVFVSPYPCKNEVDAVVDFYQARKYVVYFEAKNLEIYEDILGYFNLK